MKALMWEENNSKQQWSIFGIKALYPKYKTTQAYKEHYKYKYLLKEFKNDENYVELLQNMILKSLMI